MKVLRGRVFGVAGFLVSVRTADGTELTLDCGLAFTAFKSGDAVSLFSLNGRFVRAVSERTGLMIRLDAINDLEQVLPRAQILAGAIPLVGVKSAVSYWRHCWSRRRQSRWGWPLWCLPTALATVVATILLLSMPADVRLAQAGWSGSFAVASSVLAAVFWPGVLMFPHLLIERFRAATRDRSAQRALAGAAEVDWACEALAAPEEAGKAPLDMSFLDQPIDALPLPAEPLRPLAGNDTKVVSLPPARALDRLTTLSEKTAAIQALCEELVQEQQAICSELMNSAHSSGRGRQERRARI